MESLYLLIPIALVFLVIAVRVFFWAVNSGQYDDLETEAHRILFDEDRPPETGNKPASGAAEKSTPTESGDNPR